MYPVTRTLTAASLGLSLVALAACGDDRSVNPVAEQVEGAAGAITTASTITAEYDLYPGQSVKINPKSTSRTNRLKWTTTNSGVATVNSQGTVSAKVVGNAVVTVSGSGVLESYAVVVQQPTLTLTSFSLQPQASVTLTAGQTQQFSTSQTWSDGVTRTSGVTYTATGGTISSTGLYTAGSLAGAFMVVASCSCTTPAIADTTFVTVQAAAQLTKLTVSPKTVSLSAGASQQFAVTANWSTGATTVPPVTWTASGGTVSGTGAYVAPSTAGTYRVIVSHTGGTVRDTAVVTVAGGTTTPSPSGVLFSDDFESGNFSSTQNGLRWLSTPWADVTSNVASSGSKSARLRQGDSQSWSELRFGGLPQLPEVFIEYKLYQPSGSEPTALGPKVVVTVDGRNDKFFRLWSGPYDPANIKFGASTWGTGGIGYLGTEFTRTLNGVQWGMGEGGDFAQNPKFALIGAPNFLGRWITVRIRAKVATAANNDGVIQIWVDGQLASDKRNLPAFPPSGVGNYFETGYLMGWAASGFQSGQYMYIDDVVISTGGFKQ